MAEERERTERVRLFVALDLPELVRAEIGAWGKRELTDPALRPVAVENLHITLAFLGSRSRKDVEPVVEAIRESAGAAPLVSLADPAARPARRPRVFGLPAISPGAEVLQAALSERLVAEDLYKPEKRPFWPHVTVARVRSEGRGSRRPMRVEKFPDELPASLREPFLGVRLALYRSELQPSGARYVPLAQVELPG
jgi:RNA 2',3'-cyclic 3'-phosphodiesterase